MKKLNLDEGTQFGRNQQKNRPTKAVSKKETKKMQDQTVVLVQKVSKIDLNKDDRDAEAVIKAAMASQNSQIVLKKESRALVFKTIVNLKNHLKNSGGGGISLRELRDKIDEKLVSNEELGLAIKKLQEDGQIVYEQAT